MRTAEYRSRLAEVETELSNINAAHSGRRFPAEVRENWNRLNAEREELQATIAELDAREKRLRDLAANPNATECADARVSAPSLITAVNPWSTRDTAAALAGPDLRSRALDAVAAAPGLDTAARKVATRLVSGTGYASRATQEWALATSDPEYERAFYRLLADPVAGHRSFSSAEHQAYRRVVELREMNIGTGADGGHLTMPFQLDPSIVLSSGGSIDPFREVCRRVIISATDTWKGVRSDGVVADWYAEGAEATDDSPTLADVEIGTHRASAFVPLSIELDQDFPRVRAELGVLFADARVQLEAGAFTDGSGTGEPQGIVGALGASQTVDTASAGTYTADDAYEIVEAVPARYRARSRVLTNQSTIHTTRRFTAADEPEIVPATFDTWLGRPLHETSTLDDEVTAGNTLAIAGDFDHAVIVDRTGTSIELVPHLFGANGRPSGQRGMFMHWRVGFDVLVPNALRKLVVAT